MNEIVYKNCIITKHEFTEGGGLFHSGYPMLIVEAENRWGNKVRANCIPETWLSEASRQIVFDELVAALARFSDEQFAQNSTEFACIVEYIKSINPELNESMAEHHAFKLSGFISDFIKTRNERHNVSAVEGDTER